MTERIRFEVEGSSVVGDLHLPTAPGQHPAVVVAGPMTSVKEQVTGVYAAALARRGITALAIDHRGYGESEGEPRQYEHWGRKIADLHAALDHLKSREDVSGVGLAGVCLGSGYAATAASQRQDIRALGLVVGYYRDPAAMRNADPDGFDAKVAEGRAAREHYEATGEVVTIPAVALDGDAAMQTAELFDYYGTSRAGVANYTNAFAVMSREHFVPFDVQQAAPKLRQPVLMIHGENALSRHWARQFHDALPGEKSMHWLDGASQVAFYDSPDLVAQAADLLAAHFQRHLA
ncbi:alpha/beta hydrolase [Sphingomonas arenae]|uniref:alpha/beta hydrolase n=1 Tax=Sphingomonas arenae TaxID=2812555 RepID=UPI0019676752|nr:alpha/beta hydrolase [Sphingomonas arenae]